MLGSAHEISVSPQWSLATIGGQETMQSKKQKTTQKYFDHFVLWIFVLEVIFLKDSSIFMWIYQIHHVARMIHRQEHWLGLLGL